MLHVPPPTNQPVLQQIRPVLQVAKSCCRKSDSSSTSCNKKFICCAFYRPKANLYCSKWRRSLAWLTPAKFYPIRGQYSHNLQLADLWQDGFLPPPLPLRFFWSFFLNEKTSAADVFSSCLFIHHAHLETSLVMVSYYGYEMWHQK